MNIKCSVRQIRKWAFCTNPKNSRILETPEFQLCKDNNGKVR